jgi:rhodanese-related sulfurtransferase
MGKSLERSVVFRREKITEVTPDQAAKLQADGAVLLDVREPHEWVAGHAPGAVHLPLERLHQLPGDLVRATVLTVCRSGRRSGAAARSLAAAGIAVHNVAGGMSAWAASGLPVVGEGGAPGAVV